MGGGGEWVGRGGDAVGGALGGWWCLQIVGVCSEKVSGKDVM